MNRIKCYNFGSWGCNHNTSFFLNIYFRIRGMPSVIVSTPVMSDAKRSVNTVTTSSRRDTVATKGQNVTRGVTFQWTEFRPRDLEAKSGLKSLKKVLVAQSYKTFFLRNLQIFVIS